MQKKVLLTQRLAELKLCEDEKEARALVMAGEVYVDGQRALAGQKVAPDAALFVRGRAPYVGKGGLKLSGALDDFHIDVQGRVCIDAGASTGGFTDCLVKRGAARVYAVDVGFGQLMGSLRQNPAVVNLEKTNIGDEKLLDLSPRPTLGTVDLSYLSLTKGIPQFARVLHETGELVCLVKPLFEIDDAQARRTGEIAPGQYAPLLLSLIDFVNALPYARAQNVTFSRVTGNAGTREFFLHVALGERDAPDLHAAVRLAVDGALSLKEYKK